MDPEQSRLEYLFSKYFDKTASAEERAELATLINIEANREQVMQLFSAGWEHYQGDGRVVSGEKTDDMLQNILSTPPSINEAGNGTPVRNMFPFRRVAIAAAILLMLGVGSWFAFFNKPSTPVEVADTKAPEDIKAPEKNRAMITLANGKHVLLDSLTSGTLAVQGNVHVRKTADGQIIYDGSSAEPAYNTLYNPRGSKVVPLTLSDGTKVWLNNESSIHYPVAFVGNERKVQITGEAYFEVTHNSKMPFIVEKGTMAVQVLGTHFNVNAYDDELAIKTTLLEGSVKVIKDAASVIIKPGEQASISHPSQKSHTIPVQTVDVAQAVAWKDGLFSFTDANLPTVMRQLARWYNLDVRYEGAIPEREFNGKIGRTLTLNQVLHILTKSRVNYKIENGNKITIIP